MRPTRSSRVDHSVSLRHFEVSSAKGKKKGGKKKSVLTHLYGGTGRSEFVDEQRKGQEETHTTILPRIPCLVDTTLSRDAVEGGRARNRERGT